MKNFLETTSMSFLADFKEFCLLNEAILVRGLGMPSEETNRAFDVKVGDIIIQLALMERADKKLTSRNQVIYSLVVGINKGESINVQTKSGVMQSLKWNELTDDRLLVVEYNWLTDAEKSQFEEDRHKFWVNGQPEVINRWLKNRKSDWAKKQAKSREENLKAGLSVEPKIDPEKLAAMQAAARKEVEDMQSTSGMSPEEIAMRRMFGQLGPKRNDLPTIGTTGVGHAIVGPNYNPRR